PPSEIRMAAYLLLQRAHAGSESDSLAGLADDLLAQLAAERFGDVVGVYPTRAAFSSAFPPHALFQQATDIAIAGISLNLVCQQYSEQSLSRLIEGGTRMRCLFLAPGGQSIAARERE